MARATDKNHLSAPPAIVHCGCATNNVGNPAGAQYQNARYGEGNRVANPGVKGYGCTVCGRVHLAAQAVRVQS